MPDLTEPLHGADQRLIRTVDALGDEAWAGPSGLPGWTRAHVVAHLALNAEGLTAALGGASRGEPTPMYASREARNSDIEQLASATPGDVRTRLLGATTELSDAMAVLTGSAREEMIELVPGGPAFAASEAAGMRLREVEIHHVDLGAGYSPDDWDLPFAVLLLEAMTGRRASSEPFQVLATDADHTWTFGDGGPTVSGRAAALGWWLSGRGTGETLTTNSGELPGIEAW